MLNNSFTKIQQKSITIFEEYSTCRFIFGLFLKLRGSTFQGNKDLWCGMKPPNYFASKTQ